MSGDLSCEPPESGNRIILDATEGKEKIQIIDQADNQIKMNAVKGKEYIKLSSPGKAKDPTDEKKHTQLILGEVKKAKEDDDSYADYGIYMYSDADYKIHADNSYYKHIEGTSTTTCLGAYTTIVGGVYTSIAAVAKIDMCFGLKLDVFTGAKCVVEAGKKLQVGKLGTEYLLAENEVKKCLKKIDALAAKIQSEALDIQMKALKEMKLTAPVINIGNVLRIMNGYP